MIRALLLGLALLGVSGVCIDALFGALVNSRFTRTLRLVGVILVTGFTLIPAVRTTRMRFTNVDLIAQRLRTTASAEDIVLVISWPNGVSFERYYRGAAQWLTVPPLGITRPSARVTLSRSLVHPWRSRGLLLNR